MTNDQEAFSPAELIARAIHELNESEDQILHSIYRLEDELAYCELENDIYHDDFPHMENIPVRMFHGAYCPWQPREPSTFRRISRAISRLQSLGLAELTQEGGIEHVCLTQLGNDVAFIMILCRRDQYCDYLWYSKRSTCEPNFGEIWEVRETIRKLRKMSEE